MALGFASPTLNDIDAAHARLVDITLDNSYPTNGWAVTPANFGLTEIITIFPMNANGYDIQWDGTASKLKVYSAAGTELVNASAALNNVVVRALVIGRGA